MSCTFCSRTLLSGAACVCWTKPELEPVVIKWTENDRALAGTLLRDISCPHGKDWAACCLECLTVAFAVARTEGFREGVEAAAKVCRGYEFEMATRHGVTAAVTALLADAPGKDKP